MKKIIQIQCPDDGCLIVLTEDGKIFSRVRYDRIIDNGKKRYEEKTDWESGFEWVEIPLTDTINKYIKQQELSF